MTEAPTKAKFEDDNEKHAPRLDTDFLSICRGSYDGPFDTGTFNINVGFEYKGGELIQLFPTWKGGAAHKIKDLKTKHSGKEVIVEFETDDPKDKEKIEQIAYILFVIP